jgi:hypothetical protein
MNDIEVVCHDLKAHHLAHQTFTSVNDSTRPSMPEAEVAALAHYSPRLPSLSFLNFVSFVSFLTPLCQFLLQHDDFLQGVRMVLPLELQLAFQIGVALFEPGYVLLPKFQFQ